MTKERQAEEWLNKSWEFSRASNLKEATHYVQKAMDLFEQIDNQEQYVLCRGFLIQIWAKGSEQLTLPETERYVEETLSMAYQYIEESNLIMVEVIGCCMKFYRVKGKLQKALSLAEKRLRLVEQFHPSEFAILGIAYSSMTILYGDLGNLPKGIEYGLLHVKYAQKGNAINELLGSYINLSSFL